jgi:hypothetical protein
MRTASALRVEIEAALQNRAPAALTPKHHQIQESILCGFNHIDALRAFPRGTLVEICGLPSTGRTTLLHALLAQTTSRGEATALIDVNDSFDPVSPGRNGVVLSELLWVRCGLLTDKRQPLSALDTALKAAELLLQSGGFGILTLDMGDVPAQDTRRVPLSIWFRFRRAVEEIQTLFLVLEQEPHASSSAAVVLDLSHSGIDVEETQTTEKLRHVDGDRLIQALHTRAEIVRGQARKSVRSEHLSATLSTHLQAYR